MKPIKATIVNLYPALNTKLKVNCSISVLTLINIKVSTKDTVNYNIKRSFYSFK